MKISYSALFVLILLLQASVLLSEDNQGFDYDKSGNCIRKYRTIVVPTLKQKSGQIAPTSDPIIEQDYIGESKITIYPNPTEGALQIYITHPTSHPISHIYLFDTSGRLLYRHTHSQSSYILNMHSYSAATYLLRISINDKSQQWKIIKQ